jgi:large subunit ribosomal protein L18
LIDDLSGKTIVSAGSLKEKSAQEGNKINQASVVGKMIAEKAKNVGITTVVFDRNGYLYHGRVRSLADAAREGGLKF